MLLLDESNEENTNPSIDSTLSSSSALYYSFDNLGKLKIGGIKTVTMKKVIPGVTLMLTLFLNLLQAPHVEIIKQIEMDKHTTTKLEATNLFMSLMQHLVVYTPPTNQKSMSTTLLTTLARIVILSYTKPPTITNFYPFLTIFGSLQTSYTWCDSVHFFVPTTTHKSFI